MVYLCGQHPEVTNLNINWSDALELPTRWRDIIMQELDEIRSKQTSRRGRR